MTENYFNESGEYVPQVLTRPGQQDLVLLAYPVFPCSECGRPTLSQSLRHIRYTNIWGEAFAPAGDSIKAQLLRAGLQVEDTADFDGKQVCGECVKAGKVKVRCCHCERETSLDNVQFQAGDPAEFLCRACYESVPAAQYAKLVKEIEERHRHDYT